MATGCCMAIINEQGRLSIPLYHGTSTVFLESIMRSGLGGARDSRVFDLEILRRLSCALDRYGDTSEWWVKNSFIVELMLDQKVSPSGFNFRHGGVYLSPCRQTAQSYASSNKFGSELITTIYETFEALAAIDCSEANRIIPGDQPLRAIFSERGKSIVLCVKNINPALLQTEVGGDAREQLNRLNHTLANGDDLDSCCQQHGFVLDGIVDPSDLELVNENL